MAKSTNRIVTLADGTVLKGTAAQNYGRTPSLPAPTVDPTIRTQPQSVEVTKYIDNPNGTTTNYLSDGTTSLVKYTKNPDGSLSPTEIPTAANGFGSGVSSPYVSEYDQLQIDRYKDSQKPINREAIRKQKIAEFQAQIDATNQIFTNLTAQANVQGEGRLGQQRALASRGGTLQQPRGEAQKEGVISYNNQVTGDIAVRQQSQIAAIMTEAQNRADNEYQAKIQARELGAQSYLQYLAGAEERKATNAQAVLQGLIAQGLTIEDIPQEDFFELAKKLRMDPYELSAVYNGELTKVQQAAAEAEYERLKEERDFALELGEFGLKQDEFGFEQEKFGAEFGLEQDKFGFEQNKFANEFSLERDKFGFDQQYKNAQLGLEERKLSVDEAYKLESLGIEREKLTLAQQKALVDNKTLSGEQKKLNALALSGLNSLDIISQGALDADGSKNWGSIIKGKLGFNRAYSDAVTNLSDIIGRLRSGGAITNDEEKRFRSLMPSVLDGAGTVKTKLDRLRGELNSVSPDGGVSAPDQQRNKSELDEYLGGSSSTNPKASYRTPTDYFKKVGNGRVVTGSKFHTGGQVDIDGKIGDPIPAFEGGKVIAIRDTGNKDYGKHVIIQTPSGEKIYYAHLSGFNVKEGQTVSSGTIIGKMGNTGNVVALNGGDGSHLHIEKRDKNGRVIALDSHHSHA